jgi:hypothetical protein
MLVLADQQIEGRTVAALHAPDQINIQLLGQLNFGHAAPALLHVGPATAGQWDNVGMEKFTRYLSWGRR